MHGPVTGRSAWKGPDIVGDTDWVFRFSPRHIDEIEQAWKSMQACGRPVESLRREDFPLASLAAEFARIAGELEDGRGFVLLRGLPVVEWGEQKSTAIYFGIATWFGIPIPQNTRNEYIGHVRDQIGRPHV